MIEGAPDLVAMHPIEAEEADEEIMLLEHSFFSTNPEAFVNVPTFSAWLDQQDQTPGYRYLKKLLQVLQWQKSADHWLLKSPIHLQSLDSLLSVFPDACIVQTHRDPDSPHPRHRPACRACPHPHNPATQSHTATPSSLC